MFRVTPDFALDLIRASAWGSVLRVPECQRMFDEIDEAVQLTGIHCVLLEVGADHASAEPLQDKLRLANRISNDPTLTHTRFAYVPVDDAGIDPVIETLAKAKGFQGQRFEHRDDALAWLRAADAPCAHGRDVRTHVQP